MSNTIVYGRTAQSPDRVIAAVQGPDSTLLAAITIHNGQASNPDAIAKTRTAWERSFGVHLPENLSEAIANAPLYTTGEGNQVSMHMCSRGLNGCHVVMLNGSRHYRAEDHVHDDDPGLVRRKAEQWARETVSNRTEAFWFLASVLSRFAELSSDPDLDWGSKGMRDILVI